MSCSKITEKADEEPEDEEADDTLVVVVKPDGTVAIDQETFNRVLENQRETMNIIHFENSSNKGITTNPENGEQEINLTVQGFYPSISTKTFLSEGILSSEKSDVSKNPIYLDHCYYKDCLPTTSESIKTSTNLRNTLSTENNTNKVTLSQIENEIEEIEEITVSLGESKLSSVDSVILKEDTKYDVPVTTPHDPIQNNLSNTKKMMNLRVNLKNEIARSKATVVLSDIMAKTPDEIRNNQSNDTPRTTKSLKRLIPTKSYQIRPAVQVKNSRQKKTEVVVDPVLLQANEMVRQSSIEPKKYIQNQLMFKKNKDKKEIINVSLESASPSQKHVNQILDVPELFSSPDIIVDENKTLTKTENVELDLKANIVKTVDDPTITKNPDTNILKCIEQVNKEESCRERKVSNRIKESPAETIVTKTVEDILNDISSKIANQTEIIDEENLIDELADLNEDLNSTNFVAPSNSSHDLMNKLLSDDSLNQSDKNSLKLTVSDNKPKGSTVILAKSGRLVTLPPIETPKTRSLVKRENANASLKEQGRQRHSSENSKSINEYSEESDTDKEGNNMTSEDDPNRLWCVCRKPHNNRFMICCDTCEDWFHGKCVGITKALGEQMEAGGVEWNCPPCKKKKTDDTRKKSEGDKPSKKLEEENKKIPIAKVPTKKAEPKVTKIQPRSQHNCVQCKKGFEGVGTGLFCEESCLEKHIEDSIIAIKACCTSESPDIILFDKKNSRMITGKQAPKLSNLKQWMKENPAFQILKPSGPNKVNASKSTTKPQNNQNLTQSTLKFVKKENENRAKRPATSPDKHKAKEFKREYDVSELLQPDKMKLVFVKKDASKSSILPQKEPAKHTTPQKEPSKYVQSILTKHVTPTVSKTTAVQKVVKKKPEQVKKPEPVKEIVIEKKGEEQLRSNVRKSLLESLSSRISEEPELKTAEENLEELISKIEEELYIQFGKVDQKYKTKYRSLVFNIKDPKNLNFFKKIMFKWVTPYQLVRMTADEMASQELAEWRERENKHQIEMIRKTELDMMNQSKALLMKTHKGEEIIESKVNKETIVSELNPDIKIEEKKPQILLKLTKDIKKEKKRSKYKEGSSSSGGNRERRHHKSSRNHHKSHKDKKHRSHDRDRSKSREKKEKNVEKNKNIETETNKVTANIDVRKEEDIRDREPSSTVVITTPPRIEEEISPIWKGTISFTDVARCNVTMSRLSGNVIGLDAELTLKVLECVGRIKQQTVWEYMGKLKKSGTKDIIVTKLSASGMEQQMSYLSLYQYLSAKNRIAVIDSKPFPNIKDFYICPLSSHSPIPQVLLPLDGPGVDDYRTHLLLVIIVRNSKKQWIPSWKSSDSNYVLPDDSLALPHLKQSLTSSGQNNYSPNKSYTPPRSPTNKILSLPTPVLPQSSFLTDDDLPYIPGEEEPYSPVDEDVPAITTSSIQQQMEELTRKIEKEKLVIQMMTAGSQNSISDIDTTLDPDEEVYSPTSEVTPLTADIQLPSNIKDILSSINTKELHPTEAETSKVALDVEKKCRDPRQRVSSIPSAEPPPPGLEDEFSPSCNPDTSLPPPNFATPYMPSINYVAPIPYSYPPPGYIPDAYPKQFVPQQLPPPPPMVMDQGTYNNYNQPGYVYNTVYQPPPPPPYSKKKGSGFWASGNSKNEPKKKKFKKSDRRDKSSWRH